MKEQGNQPEKHKAQPNQANQREAQRASQKEGNRAEAKKTRRKQAEPRPMELLMGRNLSFWQELLLALLPTVTVLLVIAMVGLLSGRAVLFTSLASSAFLIYINPSHKMNSGRTLVIAQMMAALAGYASFTLLGKNYIGSGAAMILTIVLMIVLNAVHPPAVSTALLFGLGGEFPSDLALFALAVLMTLTLILLQRSTLGLMTRFVEEQDKQKKDHSSTD